MTLQQLLSTSILYILFFSSSVRGALLNNRSDDPSNHDTPTLHNKSIKENILSIIHRYELTDKFWGLKPYPTEKIHTKLQQAQEELGPQHEKEALQFCIVLLLLGKGIAAKASDDAIKLLHKAYDINKDLISGKKGRENSKIGSICDQYRIPLGLELTQRAGYRLVLCPAT